MTTQHTPDIDDEQRPERDTLVRAGRAIILLVLAVTLAYVSFGLLFLASVALTGCFMSCTDPHYVGGLLGAAALSVSLAAMVTSAVAAFADIDVRRFALRAWLFTGALVAVAAVLMIANP